MDQHQGRGTADEASNVSEREVTATRWVLGSKGLQRQGVWLLALLAIAGGTGCRRARRARQARAAAAARARVQLPANCDGARMTAAPMGTLRAPAPVQEIAVGAGSVGALVLASAGDRVYAGHPGEATMHPLGSATAGTDREADLAIVATDDGYAAAWRRTRGEIGSMVFARLRPDGTLVSPERVEPIDQAQPGIALASSGHLFAVAYVMAGAIGVQVLEPDGRPARPAVLLPGSAGAHSPSLAWMGSSFLAAWSSAREAQGTITLAQIDPASGEVRPLSALQTVSATARGTIVVGGENILLALQDGPGGADAGTTATDAGESTSLLHPAVLTTAFESNGVRTIVPQVQPGPSLEARPAAAWNGQGFSIAWSGRDPASEGAIAHWASIAPHGERQGDPLVVHGSAVPGTAPFAARLAWNGRAWVLARAGATPEQIVLHRFGPQGCDAR
jgi:hypothetical protein